MAQLLASNADINAWLPDDKLEANDVNTAQFQVEAWRLIRGQLASSFLPVILAAWADPTTTPDQIRSVAGKIIAAYLYKKTYSEDSVNIPPYAQDLYNMAIQELADIKSGVMTLLDPVTDVALVISTLAMSSADFWPNKNADGPYFTMADKFG